MGERKKISNACKTNQRQTVGGGYTVRVRDMQDAREARETFDSISPRHDGVKASPLFGGLITDTIPPTERGASGFISGNFCLRENQMSDADVVFHRSASALRVFFLQYAPLVVKSHKAN